MQKPTPPISQPPKTAQGMLSCFVPASLKPHLLGDLEEEFQKRARQDAKLAANWYWKQAVKTSSHYLTQYLASSDCLRKLTILIAVLLFPSLIIMVSWLSNMDNASDSIWNNLLQGKVHSFLLSGEVIENGTSKLFQCFDLDMYFHVPAVFWALFSFLVLFVRNRVKPFSAHQAAGWGFTLMLMPYVFGLIYIDIMQPAPRQVGPTIAFMTISIIYIVLPLAWFIVRKTKSH